jgi:site-specific recombinase XerD
MKKTKLPNLLGAVIRDYFTDHLPRLRGTSLNAIHSYRDSIVLLLRFLSRQRDKPITELDLEDLKPLGILAFLAHLEEERKNGVSTRNVRLSAIHALFHFVASRNPEHLQLAQRVLGIPFQRAQQRAIALLATMFNTGGRVQEIADLRVSDLQLTKPFQVRLFGKGRKERYCPLWNPPYSRPMSRTGLRHCSEPPQEAVASTQRPPQHGSRPSEIWC